MQQLLIINNYTLNTKSEDQYDCKDCGHTWFDE